MCKTTFNMLWYAQKSEPWHWFYEVLNQILLLSQRGSCSMMSCCSTSSPWWPRPWSTWWQRSLVYLLGLHPLRGHLLRAKLNESKPSWGTYPTMVAELISGKVWIERWQKIWSNSNFLATHSCGRSTSTWLSTAFSPSSPGGNFDLDKLHFTVLPGLVPCTLWKEKVARQLVALCLVSSLGHNTCVFFSDQPDIPCCQAVAGDVVLNLRRHGNK